MEILGLKNDIRMCSKNLFISRNINSQISLDAAERSLWGFLVKLGSLPHFIEQQRKVGQDIFYSWERILKNNIMSLLTESATTMTNRQNQFFSRLVTLETFI